MNKKELLFIINPISGGRSKTRMERIINLNLNSIKFNYQLSYTKYAHHGQEIVKERADDFDAIIAVGGDGTINEIAQSLSLKNIPMGIIPMGSGNGLARHLGIPLSTEKAISLINNFRLKTIDTATLNGHFFASIAGIGFDSLIAADFDKTNGRGFINYARLTTKEYFAFKEQDYKITIDGKTLDRKAALVTFANSNQFGFETKISPNAIIDDGLIDVCIMKKPKIFQMPLLMSQIWSSSAHKSELIEIIKGKHIIVEPNKFLYANIDGESVKVGDKVEVLVKHMNLKILIP
jgi:YegS/Rv2252/BmrU family lipid kinase